MKETERKPNGAGTRPGKADRSGREIDPQLAIEKTVFSKTISGIRRRIIPFALVTALGFGGYEGVQYSASSVEKTWNDSASLLQSDSTPVADQATPTEGNQTSLQPISTETPPLTQAETSGSTLFSKTYNKFDYDPDCNFNHYTDDVPKSTELTIDPNRYYNNYPSFVLYSNGPILINGTQYPENSDTQNNFYEIFAQHEVFHISFLNENDYDYYPQYFSPNPGVTFATIDKEVKYDMQNFVYNIAAERLYCGQYNANYPDGSKFNVNILPSDSQWQYTSFSMSKNPDIGSSQNGTYHYSIQT